MIIGIHGFKQSGKDTLAKLFVDEFSFSRVAFADKVKEALHVIFDVPREKLHGSDEDKNSLSKVRWNHLHGIQPSADSHKEFLSIRELMQIFATEMCRQVIPGIWYQYLPLHEHKHVVVSDLRFTNEAQYLKDNKALLIRVTRTGAGPTAHSSESGLADDWFDYELINDGSLEDFLQKGRDLMKKIVQLSLDGNVNQPKFGS